MLPITKIEEAICHLEPGAFQIFCDNFLWKKEKYKPLRDFGKKTGTAKTIKGNPDAYFMNDKGKYVLIAYSTQQTDVYNKTREDILKCLDPQKTGVQVKDIDEIICCCASSRIKPGEDQKLRKLCKDHGVSLTLLTAEDMAREVYQNYPTLARDHLGIPVDTSQIMSAEDFVKDYDGNETSAPLNTVFQNRKKELPELIDDIRNHRVVIVFGPAGVGKTRLVLEASRTVEKEDGYELLCIRSKGLPLFEDLISRTEEKGKYLFFIDDANELSGLGSVLECLKKNDSGYDVRVVMTVRDYVKKDVVREVRKYNNDPCLFNVPVFSDAEITDFLAINMQITNKRYVDAILAIAEGNPRIAYMAGKLAKEKKSLSSLHNVTDVYSQYYEAVIQQTGLGSNKNLCLTAGILALVRKVILNRLDVLDEILKVSNISREDFSDCVKQLSSMEVVAIQKDEVAYISDQCFGNYMLYYVFLDQKEVPFSTVLSIGFVHFKEDTIQAVYVLWNLFACEEYKKYVDEEVAKTWNKFKENNSPCFYEFAKVFHEFRPEESFVIAQEKITEIPQEKVKNQIVDFEREKSQSDVSVLEFLTGYRLYESGYFNTALELLLDYAEKSVDNAINAFGWLKSEVGVLPDSYRNDYYAEQVAIKVLHKHLKDNLYVQKLILGYISYLLRFDFRTMTIGRKHTFVAYSIFLSDTDGVKKIRQECWQILEELRGNPDLRGDIFFAMERYCEYLRGARDKNIALDDQPYCWEMVQSLTCSDLSRGLIFRDLQHSWSEFGIGYSKKVDLFQSEKWKLFVLLEEDPVNSNLGYEEYQKQRKETLKRFADSLSKESFIGFVKNVRIVWEELDSRKRDSIVSSVDIIIDQVLKNVVDAWTVFLSFLEYCPDIEINPKPVFCSLFKEQSSKRVWEELEKYDFALKNVWEFVFFEALPAEAVDESTYQLLIAFLKSDSDRNLATCPGRDMFFLDKFLSVDKDVFITTSKIILSKWSYSPTIVLRYFSSLFFIHLHSPETVLARFSSDEGLLREIYFRVLEKVPFSDFDCVFLKKLLSADKAAIDEYADFICAMAEKDYSFDSNFSNQFHMLWLRDDYQRYFDHIFDVVSEKKDFYIYSYVPTFFKGLLAHQEKDSALIQRQEAWVLHEIDQYAKVEKKMVCLFVGLSEADPSLKLVAIQRLLDLNSDFQFFKKLWLVSSCEVGTTSEIIFQTQKKIEFLNSLKSLLLNKENSNAFLQHINYLREQIEFFQKKKNDMEIEAILDRLYY